MFQARDALDIYKKFLIRMDRVADFLKVAEVRQFTIDLSIRGWLIDWFTDSSLYTLIYTCIHAAFYHSLHSFFKCFIHFFLITLFDALINIFL